jgi:import inner membrane translocase subunit TIM10
MVDYSGLEMNSVVPRGSFHLFVLYILLTILLLPPNSPCTAKTEMEMYTDLFNKIASSCFKKCSSRKHNDQDLSLGEMTCTDRCVSKYLESQQLIGGVLQKANEAQAQQQQQMTQMQQKMG